MKTERLSFDEAYDVVQQENFNLDHETALAENERLDVEQED